MDKHIEINIGKACNNKCRFCISTLNGDGGKKKWSIDSKEFLLVDFVLIKKDINKYAKLDYHSIGFLGGDISIHPDIFNIIKYAKKMGFSNINIITNAMIFDDFEKAKKLILSGTTRVNISIHSHINKIEDYLTQINGGLKRKLNAIDNFKKLIENGILKIDLSINIVLNGLNYKTILETILFYYKVKDIKDIRLNYIQPMFFTSKQDREDLMLKYSDFLPYLKKIVYFSLKYNIRITFDSIPPCIFYKIDNVNYKKIISKFLGEDFDYINEVSNISKNRVFNWKEQKKEELKIKFRDCKKCVYNDVCEGVWKEYVEKYGNSEFILIRAK